MRRLIVAFILLSMVFAAPFLWGRDNPTFGKGVAYLLIGDKDLATVHWEAFFESQGDPALRGAFMGLIQEADLWEVTKQFKQYLDSNHRSTIGLVGIALSTSGMKLSTSIDNLKRAIRLDPSYSSAYLCLGFEYIRNRNYPQAKFYFNKALAYLTVPEYKILLAKLYLYLNQPGEALNLVKNEADKQPDNYYFNYVTAQAYFHLDQLDAMDKYINTALEVKPDSNDARLLLAKSLLTKNDPQRSLSILKTLKYIDYDKDYYKTYARVLLKLKDRKCKSYLDEVYSRDNWDQDINRLMGLYYVWSKQKNGNVQNWINRAILSGIPASQLQEAFPAKYQFPEYNFLPFFDIKVIRWLSDDMLVVAATKESGDEGKLYFIRTADMKMLNVLGYTGEFQDMFLSKDGQKIIFSTIAIENRSVYIYAVEVSDKLARLALVFSRALPMPSIDVGFNYSGTLAYITDSRISKLAFESPFSIVSEIGEKTPVYPSYPFPIFQYNFAARRVSAIDINDMKLVGKVPIENVKKYHKVYEAHQSKSTIQGYIDKGKKLDLTSSEIVKVYFSNDLSSFIIYLSDLKNAFQALIYEYFNNRLFKIDETMFIGTGNYAELILKNFDPHQKTLLVLTKDDERRLITFNYRTFLSLELADNVTESYYDEKRDMFYILTERSKKSIFTETNLEIVCRKPFVREIVGARRDLSKVLCTRIAGGLDEVYFSTFTGEKLMMDGEYKFHYVGPSVQGSLHAISPSGEKTAAFINERLYMLDSFYSPEKKEKKGK